MSKIAHFNHFWFLSKSSQLLKQRPPFLVIPSKNTLFTHSKLIFGLWSSKVVFTPNSGLSAMLHKTTLVVEVSLHWAPELQLSSSPKAQPSEAIGV